MENNKIMNIGVIFAGGVGSRMHSKETPKQFLSVHGKPIIIHTLEHFEKCADIDCVVIACIESWIPHLKNLLGYNFTACRVTRTSTQNKTSGGGGRKFQLFCNFF